jgi:hypothetical protein
MLDAKVWWPLFPILLLVVVVCLTWALVRVVRRSTTARVRWLQIAAFICYGLAAVAAIASERGLVSSNLHRPFSFLTQVCLVVALVHHWKTGNRTLLWLNGTAWAAILSDTALHFLVRH